MGHPRWHMVRNTECTSFDDKIEKTMECVLEVIKQSTAQEEKLTEVQPSPLEMDSITHEQSLIDNGCDEQLSKKGSVRDLQALTR